MEITLNKTELTGALAALGKLVCRTSLIQAFQAVQIEGRANTLYFRTRNVNEEIEFRLSTDLENDFPPVLVSFEQFRLAVRNTKTKMLEMEVENGEVFIAGVKLAPVEGRFPVPEVIPDAVCVTDLPADTLSALEKLAPIVSKEDTRKILKGINLSSDGFTAANSKELSNIPAPLIIGSITLPFPLALLATKAYGEPGRLSTWPTNGETHFELTLGNWTWRAKAYQENYPNWKSVVPERKETMHYVSFQQERAERLISFLKSVPDDTKNLNGIKLSRLPEIPDILHLESSNGMLYRILAEFDPNWGALSFVIKKEFLLRLLEAGHRKIEVSDTFGPIIGTGGMGMYVTLPILVKKQQTENEQKTEQVASSQTDTQTEPKPQEQTKVQPQNTTPQTITNTTTSKQEKTTMNENTITHTMPAPTQTSTTNNESKNPLDELTANIEAFKAMLKAMFDESSVMARKVREVAIAQKQKEREYVQTKRTIERIRTASGF